MDGYEVVCCLSQNFLVNYYFFYCPGIKLKACSELPREMQLALGLFKKYMCIQLLPLVSMK